MEKRNNDLEPGVDAVALFSGRRLRARLGLQEAGAPFLQTVGTLPGLKLGGSAATDEPLLKLGFPLVHQEELYQQDVSLWGGHRKVLSYGGSARTPEKTKEWTQVRSKGQWPSLKS